MNFLAHCALALEASQRWPQGHTLRQGLLAGAIFADFGKGPIDSSLPLDLQTGIRLHRRIDAFSNQHQAIRDRCATFPPELRRYAPIFLDILGDYYLSQNWAQYYAHSRATLSQQCYEACDMYSVHLSAEQATQMTQFLTYMRSADLLANYHDWHHIERATHSVLRRLDKLPLLDQANVALHDQRDSGAAAFSIYFQDMRHALPEWVSLVAGVRQSTPSNRQRETT